MRSKAGMGASCERVRRDAVEQQHHHRALLRRRGERGSREQGESDSEHEQGGVA